MTKTAELHVVILAAGKSTRMKSQLSKVLHSIAGKSMLQHVLDTASALNPQTISIVYGSNGSQLRTSVNASDKHYWVEQKNPSGTGDAVKQAYQSLQAVWKTADYVLIIPGDTPLINFSTLDKLWNQVLNTQADLALLTIVTEDCSGFGRVLRDEDKNILAIVEEKDATVEQKAIQEIFSGIMVARVDLLAKCLFELTNNNAQKEYYLTQIIELSQKQAKKIIGLSSEDILDAGGINDRIQLAQRERQWQIKNAEQLMKNGVTIVDPLRFDVRGNLEAASDVHIDINCIFEGEVFIDSNTTVGAHCILKNCRIGKNVIIQPYTMIDGAEISDHAKVGPFTRIRPGTVLDAGVQVGNFVEIKKSYLGKNTKANHLSYLGDAQIGSEVNIGAGTITCNYDGVEKHTTHIKDKVFVGSNTSLVAPITLEKEATIGAGSTITHNAPENQLTLARSKQITLPGWRRKTKK